MASGGQQGQQSDEYDEYIKWRALCPARDQTSDTYVTAGREDVLLSQLQPHAGACIQNDLLLSFPFDTRRTTLGARSF